MPSVILGSAQFGSAYGITNEAGQVPPQDVAELLANAHSLGVDYVDTAANYGMAEEAIGDSLVPMKVGTKVEFRDPVSLQDQLERSRARLRTAHIVQVLVHDWSVLSQAERREAARELEAMRQSGMFDRCGVSVYSESELIDAATIFDQLDVIQLPVNVLDRRLARAAKSVRDARAPIRIEGRSILLQGLLAERSGPTGLRTHPCIERWHSWCLREGLSPLAAALSFAMTQDWLDHVVIGVTSVRQLDEIIHSLEPEAECQRVGRCVEASVEPCADVGLIDPRSWTRPA